MARDDERGLPEDLAEKVSKWADSHPYRDRARVIVWHDGRRYALNRGHAPRPGDEGGGTVEPATS